MSTYHQRFGEESFLAYMGTLLPRSIGRRHIPVLAIGGLEDRLVSAWDVRRTARAYQGEALMLDGMGHNLMLEPGWERVADATLDWIKRILPSG